MGRMVYNQIKLFFTLLIISLAFTAEAHDGAHGHDENKPLPEHMIGKYIFQDSTGFDEFLAVLGLDSEKRTIACTLKPTQTIGQEDGQVTIKSESKVKSTDIKFKLGEPSRKKLLEKSIRGGSTKGSLGCQS